MSKKTHSKQRSRKPKSITRPVELTQEEVETCADALEAFIYDNLREVREALGSIGCDYTAERVVELVKLHEKFHRMTHPSVHLVDKNTLRSVASDAAFPVK